MTYYKGHVSASETEAHLLCQDQVGNPRRIPELEAGNVSLKREGDTMLSREAGKLSKTYLVACNIYVSAGLPHYAPFLLQLLEDAQQHCWQL
jgi:hypothetical protein